MGLLKRKIKDMILGYMPRVRHQLQTDMILERVVAIQDLYIPASVQHQKVFPKYKGVHRGKSIVIVGTGPTSEYYKPITDAIHIAVNNAIFREDIDFQYLFFSDYLAEDSVRSIPEYAHHNKKNAIKFYLLSANPLRRNDIIPIRYREHENVESYYADSYDWAIRGGNWKHTTKYYFHPDISLTPIKSYGTTAYIAFQFALWTRPKKIYLVGMDCSKGHATGIGYDSTMQGTDGSIYIYPWIELKKFSENYYEDTEIISINPKGLKGVFRDEYMQEC